MSGLAARDAGTADTPHPWMAWPLQAWLASMDLPTSRPPTPGRLPNLAVSSLEAGRACCWPNGTTTTLPRCRVRFADAVSSHKGLNVTSHVLFRFESQLSASLYLFLFWQRYSQYFSIVTLTSAFVSSVLVQHFILFRDTLVRNYFLSSAAQTRLSSHGQLRELSSDLSEQRLQWQFVVRQLSK